MVGEQTRRSLRKRVLVTGGAGYIGSHTCLELLGAGFEVVVVDNGERTPDNEAWYEQFDLDLRVYEPVVAIAGTGDKHIITLSSNSILDFSFPHWFHHGGYPLDAHS